MKTILVLALMAFTVAANAFSVKIYSDSDRNVRSKYFNVHYAVNADLGRAWVEFEYNDRNRCFDNDWDCDDEKNAYALVDGMSLDNATGNIVYKNNGKNVVCAETYVKRSWIGTSSLVIKPTGNCTFSQKLVKSVKDDGRFRKVKSDRVLYLNVR